MEQEGPDTSTTDGSGMAAIRELTDWAVTPLGPVDGWSTRLKLMARMALVSRFPMIVLWGPQLVQLYNDEYRRIFMGAKHPRGMGQPTAECWPEVWHLNEPIYRRVRQREAVYIEDQEYLLYPSGRPEAFYLTASFDPIEDDDGRVEGVLVTLQDTTRRVLAERENAQLLAQAQDTARTLQQWFEQAPGFVALLRGPRHVFEMVNQAYLQLVGRRDVLGKPALEALPEAGEQGFGRLLDDVHESGKAFIGRGVRLLVRRVPDAAPAEVFLDFVYQPVVDASGAVTGVFVQGHDVSEQHRAVQALQEADRRKDEFLATLAHELRNPLAPIRQASQLAQANGATDAQKRWSLGVIDRQVQHMALLLDDLLDVARVSRGRLQLRRQSVDLREAIDAAIETARPLIESKQHAISVVLPQEPVGLHADPLRITQLLSNLLTNAAKYTDARGSIEVSASVDDGWVEVRVRDNGIGLEGDATERVFGMFSQVKSAYDRSEGGLGIGLALSRGLAQLHGGTLHATSEGLGRGAAFVLRLPIGHDAGPGLTRAPTTPVKHEGACRVLLADDNADAVESLAALLQLEGHEVHVAHSGQAALVLAQEALPEVAILDIGMPGMNGYEVARRLRAAKWAHGMRLIALTGWGQSQDRERALYEGFDHHCTKPLDLQALRPLLRPRVPASTPPQDSGQPMR